DTMPSASSQTLQNNGICVTVSVMFRCSGRQGKHAGNGDRFRIVPLRPACRRGYRFRKWCARPKTGQNLYLELNREPVPKEVDDGIVHCASQCDTSFPDVLRPGRMQG